jgi:hypothetical protein
VFPGSGAAFQAITAGSGSVTVDVVDSHLAGLQSLTLVSATNANVTIPAFPMGTTNPVTSTFTVPNSGQPVDFTIRASARRDTVTIRAQCGTAARASSEHSPITVPDVSFWMQKQTAPSVDGLLSLVLRLMKPAEETARN